MNQKQMTYYMCEIDKLFNLCSKVDEEGLVDLNNDCIIDFSIDYKVYKLNQKIIDNTFFKLKQKCVGLSDRSIEEYYKPISINYAKFIMYKEAFDDFVNQLDIMRLIEDNTNSHKCTIISEDKYADAINLTEANIIYVPNGFLPHGVDSITFNIDEPILSNYFLMENALYVEYL